MHRLTGFLICLLALVAQPAAAQSRFASQVQNQLSALITTKSADVGIAAIDLVTGENVNVHGQDHYPMASTVKVAVAATYLSYVENGDRSLDDMIAGRTASSLMRAMIVRSDNHATDLLLDNLGGPKTIQKWLKFHNVEGMRVDRTIAQLLRAKRDLYEKLDSTTPIAFALFLQRLDKGELLRPSSRAYLLDLMADCQTGKNRMRALLPAGVVAHKTGTLNGYSSDVGFITLPNGHRVAIAIFARGGDNRPRAIAEAARLVYDGFKTMVRWPYSITGTPQ
ncbi:serine hydrolase [Sphingomonas sabuli]|uniref:Beta-lactamase n=1 Tax=Sphingomonas sabuli TaxID=2764186 RepID=A0A7G9L1F5_9SPHN|nr:serine hydrolase [Sphingomonas sabuli]QNM82454.1 serine hydrolase [Sphingomonas sabuli]